MTIPGDEGMLNVSMIAAHDSVIPTANRDAHRVISDAMIGRNR
jgi:hypothetical protein